jgi:SAM-dependent methyltransferase
MTGCTKDNLQQAVKRYRWYHRIHVGDGVCTEPQHPEFQPIWAAILGKLLAVDFRDKRVLDVGCRDGLFSFEAERRGAREVIGIDHVLSQGAVEFLIPHFQSQVRMHQLSLYDLTPEHFGRFDIICFFGVLYHLRYPVWGLRRISDCLADDGLLLLESGILVDDRFADHELLYCPVESSPYEPTSCTFFNQKALCTTLECFGCRPESCWRSSAMHNKKANAITNGLAAMQRMLGKVFSRATAPGTSDSPQVRREFFVFRKGPGELGGQAAFRRAYWDGTPPETESRKPSC